MAQEPNIKGNAMFYLFTQNNTGGSFDLDENLTHHVIVEADNEGEAEGKFRSLGGYFDGVYEGRDCNCCGDRWHRPSRWDSSEEPEVYGDHPATYVAKQRWLWMPKGREVVIHYKDGSKVWF